MINYLSKPFKWFFKLEAASGLILLFAAIIALFISNSNLADLYFSTLNKYLFIGINNFGLKLSVIHWINDALMAIFFFFVTLEIKREFIQGELSNPKQALLPIIGAVGGMLVPALVYVYINLQNPETLKGWAIPSATDIAFSLGVLSLLGSRVPISLKVFLTALAKANRGIIPKATYGLMECSIFNNNEKSFSFFLCGITDAKRTPAIVAWTPDS